MTVVPEWPEWAIADRAPWPAPTTKPGLVATTMLDDKQAWAFIVLHKDLFLRSEVEGLVRDAFEDLRA